MAPELSSVSTSLLSEPDASFVVKYCWQIEGESMRPLQTDTMLRVGGRGPSRLKIESAASSKCKFTSTCVPFPP